MKMFHTAIGAMLCIASLSAATVKEKFKEHVDEIRATIPAIGLVSEVEYDGLTMRNFRFDTDEKYTIVDPGEKISATLEYEIDANKLKNLHLHHFFYGLTRFDGHSDRINDGPIGCLVHSVGLKDSMGKAEFSFHAPQESGFYLVHIQASHDKVMCSKAREEWWNKDNAPPSNTIIGWFYVE